jgi:hypothetical protein
MATLEKTLIDTGPIVALLVAEDAHNAWARRVWGELEPPLLISVLMPEEEGRRH